MVEISQKGAPFSLPTPLHSSSAASNGIFCKYFHDVCREFLFLFCCAQIDGLFFGEVNTLIEIAFILGWVMIFWAPGQEAKRTKVCEWIE